MRRHLAITALLLSLLALGAAPAAAEEFGLQEVGVAFEDELGGVELQAGSHPFAMHTTIKVNTQINKAGKEEPAGAIKDLHVSLPEGFAGAPRAVQQCSAADFTEREGGTRPACPDASAVGYVALKFSFDPFEPGAESWLHPPVYNLRPPPGVAARLGFVALEIPVTVDITLNPDPPHNVLSRATNIAQAALFVGSVLTIWGDPGDPKHDELRGDCVNNTLGSPIDEPISTDVCPLDVGEREPFLTLPRSCEGTLRTGFHAIAWNTAETDEETAETPGMQGCSKLDLKPKISALPTSQQASSPSGLDFTLHLEDQGIKSPTGLAASEVKKAVVTLPEGVTVNPSQAEGLAVCSEEDLRGETAFSAFGAGCPAASKIGNVEAESPLLPEEVFRGSLFVGETKESPFRIALYMVIKDPELGLVTRLAGEVRPDPASGRLITTFENLPQLPVSDFRLRFREGGRSPLITPPSCGSYVTEAVFTPWANPQAPVTRTASFQITGGPGGGPCPPPGPPPFEPGFSAGTLNPSAAQFSPVHMRLTRRDGDQDMTKLSATLPPGLLGKLAGVERCPDAAIAAAKGRKGRSELAQPSCPASSRLGSTLAGAGAGAQLTFVPGSLYLAGPHKGAPLSVVAITPAVAGPFDIGTVVVRVALDLDPKTAEVKVDGAASDPIPHILAGIPLKLRDLRVSVDRPGFTLNPTDCSPSSTRATIFGSFADLFNPADDVPVFLSSRFQAANCASLSFGPRLRLRLKGGARRGDHPATRALLTARPGEANISGAVVRLPRSAFLDQGHIGTVCTRVQFAADKCPKGAIYGHVRAFTPLLDEPLEGPAYLRSSNNVLPDMVFALKGLVDVEASARIDSVKGGLRLTFSKVPDAPVSKVIASFPGGRKGLIVNSRSLCAAPSRAKVLFSAHNGRRRAIQPLLRPTGCRGGKAASKRR